MSTRGISPEQSPGGDLLLPTPPGVIRRFWARHPWWTDSLIAAGYFVPTTIALLVNAHDGTLQTPDVARGVVVAVALSAAVLFRRHWPATVLAATWVGELIAFSDYGPVTLLPVLLALYAVAVYRDVRSAWVGFGGSVVAVAIAAFVNDQPSAPWGAAASQSAIAMLAAALIGINVGNRKRYVDALLDRAAQLARERDQQAQLARVSERARIAREMHDIVAHSLSVIVALADGADALAVKNPERSRAAMREVAATGRGSMAEMRRLLGVLSDDSVPQAVGPGARDDPATPGASAALSPQPGVGQLVELVESFRAAGLPTRLKQTGRNPRNPGVQLTVYRIVQESLTNALRYAERATLVVVHVNALPGRVEVVVADDGRRRRIAAPSQGSGRGIIGLRERVALYGGTLDAQPSPGGGWRVRATMAVEEPTDEKAHFEEGPQ